MNGTDGCAFEKVVGSQRLRRWEVDDWDAICEDGTVQESCLSSATTLHQIWVRFEDDAPVAAVSTAEDPFCACEEGFKGPHCAFTDQDTCSGHGAAGEDGAADNTADEGVYSVFDVDDEYEETDGIATKNMEKARKLDQVKGLSR